MAGRAARGQAKAAPGVTGGPGVVQEARAGWAEWRGAGLGPGAMGGA